MFPNRTFWLFIIALELLGVFLIAHSVRADEITIHLRFSADTNEGKYQDSLAFTEVEWNNRDQSVIEAHKKSLADAWVAFIREQRRLQTIAGKQDRVSEIDMLSGDLAQLKTRLLAEIAELSK